MAGDAVTPPTDDDAQGAVLHAEGIARRRARDAWIAEWEAIRAKLAEAKRAEDLAEALMYAAKEAYFDAREARRRIERERDRIEEGRP